MPPTACLVPLKSCGRPRVHNRAAPEQPRPTDPSHTDATSDCIFIGEVQRVVQGTLACRVLTLSRFHHVYRVQLLACTVHYRCSHASSPARSTHSTRIELPVPHCTFQENQLQGWAVQTPHMHSRTLTRHINDGPWPGTLPTPPTHKHQRAPESLRAPNL